MGSQTPPPSGYGSAGPPPPWSPSPRSLPWALQCAYPIPVFLSIVLFHRFDYEMQIRLVFYFPHFPIARIFLTLFFESAYPAPYLRIGVSVSFVFKLYLNCTHFISANFNFIVVWVSFFNRSSKSFTGTHRRFLPLLLILILRYIYTYT